MRHPSEGGRPVGRPGEGSGPVGHLAEGALVRFLDREGSTEEIEGVREHLSGCWTCAERLGELRRRSRRLGRLLEEADGMPVEPAAARARRSLFRKWGRAKVAGLVLIGLGAAAIPAVARYQAAAGNGDPTDAPVQVERERSAAGVGEGGGLSFPVGGPLLDVTFGGRGTVRIQMEEGIGGEVRVRVIDGADPAWTVLPGELRAAVEGYVTVRIETPPSVRRVDVRAGSRTAASVSWDALPADLTVEVESPP